MKLLITFDYYWLQYFIYYHLKFLFCKMELSRVELISARKTGSHTLTRPLDVYRHAWCSCDSTARLVRGIATLTIPADSVVVRPQQTNEDVIGASDMLRTEGALVKQIKSLGLDKINEPRNYKVGHMLISRVEMDITKEKGPGIYVVTDTASAMQQTLLN